MLAQALAHLPFDLSGLLQERGEGPVRRDPLLGGDLAHAGNSRHVVDAVAHQGEHVDDLRRLDAEELLDAGVVHERLFAGVEDAHAGPHQLQHVLVGGDDHHVEAPLRALDRERSDDVVRLVPRKLQDRDAVRGEDPPDVGKLRGQIVLHRSPVGLVGGIGVVALCALGAVPGHRQVLGRVLAQHLAHHGDEAVDRVGRLARRGGETLDGVVGAVDVGHRVDQVELGAGLGHGPILWGGRGAIRARPRTVTRPVPRRQSRQNRAFRR